MSQHRQPLAPTSIVVPKIHPSHNKASQTEVNVTESSVLTVYKDNYNFWFNNRFLAWINIKILTGAQLKRIKFLPENGMHHSQTNFDALSWASTVERLCLLHSWPHYLQSSKPSNKAGKSTKSTKKRYAKLKTAHNRSHCFWNVPGSWNFNNNNHNKKNNHETRHCLFRDQTILNTLTIVLAHHSDNVTTIIILKKTWNLQHR